MSVGYILRGPRSGSQLPEPLQDTLMEGVKHYFGGGAAAMNLHERIADLLLMELSFSMEDPGTAFALTPPLRALKSGSKVSRLLRG